jgi:hypothetical protein
MLLNSKMLNTILQNYTLLIPEELERELLTEYGNEVTTEDGRTLEYSEQDIGEQLRKILRPYTNANREVKNFTLT